MPEEVIDQWDIMNFERYLSEFLDRHSDFEENVREWQSNMQRSERGSLEDLSNPNMSMLSKKEAHPLYSRVAITREEINNWFLTGDIKPILPVVQVINAGRAIEVFDELEVLDLSESSDKTIEEEYVNRLLNEDESDDALFEIEMAGILHRNHFQVKLVKEGNTGGKDLVVTEDDTSISIECKRKGLQSPFDQKMQKIGYSISDKVWDQIDINKDSFAVRISSDDAPTEDDIEYIANEMAEVIGQKKNSGKVTIDEKEFTVELIDYYDGPRKIGEGITLPQSSSDLNDLRKEVGFLDHLNLDVDPMDTEGHGDLQLYVSDTGEAFIANAYIMEFDFPKYDEVKYNDWVHNTIRSASDQLSGQGPGVVFIDIPYVAIEQMKRRQTDSHHGGQVSQWERLIDEQLIGLLHKSNSLNAVVFTSQLQYSNQQRFDLGRPIEAESPVHSVINISPAEELPPNFREFIEGSQIE